MKRRSSPVSVLELGRKPPSHERHGGNAMAACEYAAVFEYFIYGIMGRRFPDGGLLRYRK